jgi:hypothetical protein
MTTSINRSRRLDNIFAGRGNATVLEPEGLENKPKIQGLDQIDHKEEGNLFGLNRK